MKNKILNIFTNKNGGSDLLENINGIIKNINLLLEDVKKANAKDTMDNINDIL